MSIQNKIETIYGLELVGIRLGLQRIRKVLSYLKNPHLQYPTIHVAGTNGKGSTAHFLSSICIAHSQKVGLYTSPHLFRFNERIQVQNELISDQELECVIDEVQEVVDMHKLDLTFFEFTTTVAFLYFAKQKVDIAIIEIGLGGELDATNVIKPAFTVIPTIDMDHQEFLGNTLKEVTINELSILQKNTLAIMGEQKQLCKHIFETECRKKGISFIFAQDKIQATSITETLEYQIVSFSGTFTQQCKLPAGSYQIHNAKMAIVCAQQLGVSQKNIVKGLESTTICGRMHCVHKNPIILIDGAHNELGMTELLKTISLLPKPRTLIYARSIQKEKKEMGFTLYDHFETIIATQGDFKSFSAKDLANEIQERGFSCSYDIYPKSALQTALQKTPKSGSIVVTGSLYMIPLVLEEFL